MWTHTHTATGCLFLRVNSTPSLRFLIDRLARLEPRMGLFSFSVMFLSCRHMRIQRINWRKVAESNLTSALFLKMLSGQGWVSLMAAFIINQHSLTWKKVLFWKKVNWTLEAIFFCSGERFSVRDAGSVILPKEGELSTALTCLWNPFVTCITRHFESLHFQKHPNC